jgi:maltose alpha-D-glucosyltransferase/alpha-amylase
VRQRAYTGVLYDAFANENFCYALLDGFSNRSSLEWAGGRLEFVATKHFARLAGDDLHEQPVQRPATEGTNSAFLVGDRLFLKAYRRLRSGINPEWEMGRYLTESSACECIANVAGAIEFHAPDGSESTVALVQACVRNQGDGFDYTVHYLDQFLEVELTKPEAEPAGDLHGSYLLLMGELARRTAELHRALARDTTDAAFKPMPLDKTHLAAWASRLREETQRTVALIEQQRDRLPAECRPEIDAVLAARGALDDLLESLIPDRVQALCTRFHGDYHLGQVLLVENDFVITDLEGEPGRDFDERRRKDTPLVDSAGMLRSLRYARGFTSRKLQQARPSDAERADQLLEDWCARASSAFLTGYRDAMAGCAAYPGREEDAERLLELAVLEKLLYEIRYELANRPLWLPVPLRDLIRRLSGE